MDGDDAVGPSDGEEAFNVRRPRDAARIGLVANFVKHLESEVGRVLEATERATDVSFDLRDWLFVLYIAVFRRIDGAWKRDCHNNIVEGCSNENARLEHSGSVKDGGSNSDMVQVQCAADS